jgi:hypothetical protein
LTELSDWLICRIEPIWLIRQIKVDSICHAACVRCLKKLENNLREAGFSGLRTANRYATLLPVDSGLAGSLSFSFNYAVDTLAPKFFTRCKLHSKPVRTHQSRLAEHFVGARFKDDSVIGTNNYSFDFTPDAPASGSST